MPASDNFVRARIDSKTKNLAAQTLADIGLTVSDAIRLLMIKIADEKQLPFTLKAPNTTTQEAIAELEAGRGKRAYSIDEFIRDLHAHN